MTNTTATKADQLAIALAAHVLAATGADVRVTVGDQIMLSTESETDRDVAQAFMLARPGFVLVRSFEMRGRHRATFRPAT